MIQHLKNLGLADKEAKVYAAMLELGPSSVLEISARTGVNRPTTYVQIESLRRMGLVSTQTKGKKQLFQAEAPNQFQTILEKEEALVQQKKKELSDVLPDLLSMFNASGGRPKVRFIEGIEGVEKAQELFRKSGDKMLYEISSFDDVVRIFPNFLNSMGVETGKRKIDSKLIYTYSAGPLDPGIVKNSLAQMRYVSPDKLPINFDVAISGNNVTLLSLRGNVSGVFIEHEEIANSLKAVFEYFWSLIPAADSQKKSP